MKEAKQIIVVRKDLGMSRGKISAQVAYASLGCVLKDAQKSERTDHIETETSGWVPVKKEVSILNSVKILRWTLA